MSDRFKKIWNICTWIIVIIVALFAFAFAGVRLIGLTPYTVLSGSMEPAYKVGSLIYVKDVSASDIKIGDPISFKLENTSTVATHRVIDIDNENSFFYTKGDANSDADNAPVSFSSLIGKPVFTIPLLGYASSYIATRQGGITCIVVAVLLLLMISFPDIIDKFTKWDQKRKSSEKAKTQSM